MNAQMRSMLVFVVVLIVYWLHWGRGLGNVANLLKLGRKAGVDEDTLQDVLLELSEHGLVMANGKLAPSVTTGYFFAAVRRRKSALGRSTARRRKREREFVRRIPAPCSGEAAAHGTVRVGEIASMVAACAPPVRHRIKHAVAHATGRPVEVGASTAADATRRSRGRADLERLLSDETR
jgi:hypothetical protein